jgi:hypothetical protein
MSGLDNPPMELLMLVFNLFLVGVCVVLGLKAKRVVLWFAFPLTLSFKVILFTILVFNISPLATDTGVRTFLSRIGDLSFGTVFIIQAINGRLTNLLDQIVDKVMAWLLTSN